jgi:glucose/arabinose dehydrogenase
VEKQKYSAPESSWFHVVGPTGIKFLNSDKLGAQYQNDIFVGDVHRGNLYHFKLNKDRTGLALDGALADTIANDDTELSTAIFGKGFGGITDIEVGPDGYLYVVSIGLGKIFKIVPKVYDNNNVEVE